MAMVFSSQTRVAPQAEQVKLFKASVSAASHSLPAPAVSHFAFSACAAFAARSCSFWNIFSTVSTVNSAPQYSQVTFSAPGLKLSGAAQFGHL